MPNIPTSMYVKAFESQSNLIGLNLVLPGILEFRNLSPDVYEKLEKQPLSAVLGSSQDLVSPPLVFEL